ncbi:MAG TPA: TIGR03016 family PEP-CTERM system-associated outer membrane protein [Burkholderiales bacterium]|nr:TIGR03016 family PEP-CTERM system-associated outer membrane protein [Burkholderiales bacterium]
MIRFLPSASVLPSLLVGPVACAAEFELRPTLTVGQYYTDNVSLAPRGLEQSDWVTMVTPGLIFNYNGAKLKFFAALSADVIYRGNDSSVEVEPRYTGGTVGSMEIVDRLLYLDTDSTVSQQGTSAFGRQALNNVNTTDDRATVLTTRVSPYLRYFFGTDASAEVRYSYTIVQGDAATGGSAGGSAAASRGANSGGNRVDVHLASGPAYKRTTWTTHYYYDRVNYDLARDTTAQSITGGLRHLITPFVGLLANVGYEDNNYISTTTTPTGAFWSAGFDWNPSPRTQLAATTGRRYYGPSHSFLFSHRTRLTVWNVRYSESISSYRQQLLAPVGNSTADYLNTLNLTRIPDPVARQQAVNDFIQTSGLPPTLFAPVTFFTNQFYLDKTWSASVGLQGPRHTFFVNFFETSRESQAAGLPDPGGDFSSASTVKQTGGGVVWTWRLTAVDSSTMSAGYNRSETPGPVSREEILKYLRVTYVHQFSPKMSGSINMHRLDNDSTSAGGSYLENQISAQLQMRF